MKTCPNPKCMRVMEDSAISCICGYYFTPGEKALILDHDILAQNVKISTRKMPIILKGYMIALGVICLLLLVSEITMVNKTYILNAKKMIVYTLIGYGVVFFILWMMVGRMIFKRSDTLRWILIVVTFPLGMLLIAPSVAKYVSPWEYGE